MRQSPAGATSSKVLDDIKTIEKPDRTDGLRPSVDFRDASRTPRAASISASSTGNRSPGTVSIIGSDLSIIGTGLRIVTRGTLQVEGKIEGDVIGNEVIISETGHVTGVVTGQSVVVHGTVAGTVKGMTVSLMSSARVEGDVVHQKLSVDQGAQLEGRVRRPSDPTELSPNLE